MKIVAVVRVRMGSSRLPGKVLHPVLEKPLLGHLLDRLECCRRLDGIVIATSTRPENDPIEAFCRRRGVACFRGDEDDVLGRMAAAVAWAGAEVGVEVFGDCPLIDPAIVDDFVSFFLADGGWDFVGNDLVTTFPPGQEVEVFRAAALADAARRCGDPAIREHSTLFIRRHPDLYRVLNREAEGRLRRPDLELEVDDPEDLAVVEAVLARFEGRPDVGLAEIIGFLDAHPDIRDANTHVERRWKQFRHAR